MEATLFYLSSVCGLAFVGLIYAIFKQSAKIKSLQSEARLKTIAAAEHSVSVYNTIEKVEKVVHTRIDETQRDARLMGEKIIDVLSDNLDAIDKDIRSEIDSRLAALEVKLTKKKTSKKADQPLNS